MDIYNSKSCCGMAELSDINYGLDDFEQAFRNVYINTDNDPHCYGIIIFTDAVRMSDTEKGGEVLAEWIKKKRFGRVIKTAPAVNPNSGNKIVVWAWTPNKKAKAFLEGCT